MTAPLAISEDGRILTVATPAGQRRFHALWLVDNALDGHSRSAANGQKLITLLDQPGDPIIDAARLDGDTAVVEVAGKTCHFPLPWLTEHSYDHDDDRAGRGWLAPHLGLWGRDFAPFCVNYQQLLSDDRCLYDWLTAFRRHGLVRVGGLPPGDPEAIVHVAERFGYIRPTNYGQVFDVRTELNPSNLAFTGLGLEVHTDNPYRDPVPTIQLLACMANSAPGGDSLVVDGFAAAKTLQETDPQAFELLSAYPVDFRYAGGSDVDLRAQKPMIELSADGELIAVRFNNRSAAPLSRVPFALVPQFYRAMQAFARLLHEPKLELSFKLSAGELFMVDNRRVLHGRNAVVGAGDRWLRGCYADVDAAESKRRVLARRLGAIPST